MINFTPLFFPKPKPKGFTHKLLLSTTLITVAPTVQAMYQDDDQHTTQHTAAVLASSPSQEDLGDDAPYAGFEDIQTEIERFVQPALGVLTKEEDRVELIQSIGLLLRHRKLCGYPDIEPMEEHSEDPSWDELLDEEYGEERYLRDPTSIGTLIEELAYGEKPFLSFVQSSIQILNFNDTPLRREQIANCLILLRHNHRDPSTYAYYIKAANHLLEGSNDETAYIPRAFILMLSTIEECMPNIPKEKVLEEAKKLKPNRYKSHESIFQNAHLLHKLQSGDLFMMLQILGQISQTLDDEEYTTRLWRLGNLSHGSKLFDHLKILAPELEPETLPVLKGIAPLRLFSTAAQKE